MTQINVRSYSLGLHITFRACGKGGVLGDSSEQMSRYSCSLWMLIVIRLFGIYLCISW